MKKEDLQDLISIREVLIACASRHLKELRDPSISGTAMVKQAEVGEYVGEALRLIDLKLKESGVQFSE